MQREKEIRCLKDTCGVKQKIGTYKKTVNKMRTYSIREEIFYLLVRTYVSTVLYLNIQIFLLLTFYY